MLIFLFLANIPWWLLLTVPALGFVAWLDLRALELRTIMVFWWILFVILLYIPGWILMKGWIIYRKRQRA